jgi:glycosyltransferase involved in cell wall biosynthesis
MKNLLILQNSIHHYRIPVYVELCKYYNVTVLHSGAKVMGIDRVFNEIIMPNKKIGPFYIQSGILTQVASGEYDVIIAMFDVRWLNNVLAVFFKKNARFIFWGHRYSNNVVINKVRDLLMLITDGILLYSNSEVVRMNSRGIENSKIFVAPNTMYISNCSDGSSSIKNSFIFVGRAQKRKQVDILIRSFSEILDRIPSYVKLNIIGSGVENENLKILANQLNISDRVNFMGEIIDEEKLKYLFHQAYAYISPGPVGLSVLQSFAYGIPVVTNHSGKHGPEFSNLIPNNNALLFNNFGELKEILVSLCVDSSLSSRLGKNAYEFYSNERTLEKMIFGFKDAIENIRDIAK